jgi:hypothetical protein
VRIRYGLGEDWNGSPSIFFRVVLTDNASQQHLRGASLRVASTVLNEIKPDEYFNFRSVSEQAALKEEAWA